MIKIILESQEFVMSVKLLLSLLCGGLLGFERERKGRPAGFRTYILVSVGATLVMITNQYLYDLGMSVDPTRMGAQVISGIGFLGVGTIIVTGNKHVRGLTTAAGLWATASVGLAIGAGNYYAAILVTFLMYVAMNFLKVMDKRASAKTKRLDLYVVFEDIRKISFFIKKLKSVKIVIKDLEIQNFRDANEVQSTVFFSLDLPEAKDHEEIIESLEKIKGVIYIEKLF